MSKTVKTWWRLGWGIPVLLILGTVLLLALPLHDVLGGGSEMESPMSWQEVERLISEDKFQAALEQVEELRQAAERVEDGDAWTRALIKEVQLRIGLHGYETSVRFLREQTLPEPPVELKPHHQATVRLFYASSLVQYLRQYSWEIRQRERVISDETVDLKQWTTDQIMAEAGRAYVALWQERETWGSETIGRIAEYVQANTYPARIRGTLRDAVTYLWVEFLSDSSFWRPEHSNEIYRLSLDRLLAEDSGAEENIALADRDTHPLLKLVTVLADLEAWHAERDLPEAAFSTRLERLRRLSNSFSSDEDRARLKQDLETRLDALGRRYEWWSVGRAELAEMVRRENEPDSEIRARQLAKEGAEAHPESYGGLRCKRIVASIEAPSYSLSAMANDQPGRRSILVSHRNLPQLYLRAYRFDLLARVTQAKDRNLLPGYQDIPRLMEKAPAHEWMVDLPETPDYREHRTYVTPPIPEPGAYVIVASARKDFRQPFNQMVAVQMMVGDLVLLSQQFPNEFEVTVRSGETGQAVEGAQVELWEFDWRSGHRQVKSLDSDRDGVVTFPFMGEEQGYRRSFFVLARYEDQLALDQNRFTPYSERPEQQHTAALLYTDRAVYRPQQEILWKVVAYRGTSGGVDFKTLTDETLKVELLDPNYQIVATADVKTNAYGSASGRFDIPTGRLLGDWQIRASIGGATSVKVEEYKRPTFEVEFKDPDKDLRLNREAEFVGEARYYFGLPVAAGTAAWRVTRQPIYPTWGRWSFYPWPPTRQAPQVIAAGESAVGADGTFLVSFTPEADEREAAKKGVSYRYELSADVTDEGGETRSTSRSFRLGFVAIEAQIQGEQDFFFSRSAGGEAIEFELLRTDLNGVPQPGEGEWRLVALEEPRETLLPAEQPLIFPEDDERYRTPGDRLSPRWAGLDSVRQSLSRWQEGEEIAQGSVEHGDQGKAKITQEALRPGAWRLHYTTRDTFGGVFETTRDFLVVENGSSLALPSVLLAEQRSVPVGETARFVVHSGLDEQEMVFEIFRDGDRLERRTLLSGGMRIVDLPVTAKDRGGFSVRLTNLRDHQLMTTERQIFVPWDDRQLEIEFETFRDRLRPGAQETWRVRVRGKEGADLDLRTAELLAYMHDRSLDLFAVQMPPDPLALYPSLAGAQALYSNLGQARQVWRAGRDFVRLPQVPSLSNDRLKFYDGRAIGGPGVRSFRGGDVVRKMRSPVERLAVPSAPPAPMAMAGEPEAIQESMAVTDSTMEATVAAADAGPPPGNAASASSDEPVPLREDFAETAFWEPHLLLEEDGTATIEFEVPDSVTEWRVWVHAITRDLRAGSLEKKAKSVKELLVRPYLPRFLREGDRAELEVVINNAGEDAFSGELSLGIVDPQTGESKLDAFGLDPSQARGRSFRLEAGGSTALRFPIIAPRQVGEVAFEVVGRAGSFSDGERRPLVILPSRLHLAQSRFAALQDADRRVLEFADMRADDPTLTHDQLVVTLDAQLFYSVLSAVPYLLDYPYDCTEQIFNRYLSSGILTSVFSDHPAVAAMAETLATRETQLEPWREDDPNRRMMLEESPWLQLAKGGVKDGDVEGMKLLRLLDPEVATTTRRVALRKLEEAQTAAGGFPWWPGGPPSPYITVYLLHGFSKALEFGVEVPQEMIVRAWQYLHQHYVSDLALDMQRNDCCWETITFLNYVLSAYPDESWTGGTFTEDDRRRMLDFSFDHWRKHSPFLKSYLALTLHRAGRTADAKLVFDSVMDSARTTQDEGTFWAPEDRAWLWYNDTIETHAFALRTLTELDPEDKRRQGLVHWLMLNKKLNHWKSTRATAEVLYALVHYLDHENQLAVREAATVSVGEVRHEFVFEPDEYTGRGNQLVIAGPEVESESMSKIVVEKSTPGLMFASATWHFATDELPAEARGDFFSVERRYFRRVNTGREWALEPLAEGTELEVGDQLEVHLSLRAKHAAEYVHLRDPRGAGFEPESTSSGYRWDLGLGYYEEIRDSGSNFFFEWLPAGEYTFKYRLRANLAGTFRVGPATVQSLYAPEFVGYSSGANLTIKTEEK